MATTAAAAMATMSMLRSTKCMTTIINHSKQLPTKPSPSPGMMMMMISTPSPRLPKSISASKSLNNNNTTTISTETTPLITGTALAGAFFTALGSCDPAMAAQQVAEIAEGDNRGLALLLPIIPAIAWVLFNILQPALNQINRMRSDKAVIVGLSLGGTGLGASGFLSTDEAVAAVEGAAAGGDSRGQLLLFVVLPAIAWVLYNILQPALNQINRMRSQ